MNCSECGCLISLVHPTLNECFHWVGKYGVVYYNDGSVYVHSKVAPAHFGTFLFRLDKPTKLTEQRIEKLLVLI